MATEGDQPPYPADEERKEIPLPASGQPFRISRVAHDFHARHLCRKSGNSRMIVSDVRDVPGEGLFYKCPALYGA
jgi:hypothetical protein